jgi:nitrogen fixation/metabolism regulation signal transduction histidine kinase
MGSDRPTDDMVRDIEDMDAILDQFLAFIRDGRDEPVEEVDLSDLVREVVAPYNQTEERCACAWSDPAVPAAPGVDEAPAEQPDRQRPAPRRPGRRGGGLVSGRRVPRPTWC